MSDEVPGERSVSTTDGPRPRPPDGEPTPGPGFRPPWAGRGTPRTPAVDPDSAAPAVAVDPGSAALEAVGRGPAVVLPPASGLEEPTVPVDWPAPVEPAEPLAEVSEQAAAPAAQDEPVLQPVVAAQPTVSASDDDLALGVMALALGVAPPIPPAPYVDLPAEGAVTGPAVDATEPGLAGNPEVAVAGDPELVDDDADLGLTALALALEVEPPIPADLRPPIPEAPEPPAPPAAAIIGPSDETVAKTPEPAEPSPPPPAIRPTLAPPAAPHPDVPDAALRAPTILPAGMVATPPPTPPPPDDPADAEAGAGADELLALWAAAEDEKVNDDVEPWLRRRVIGPAAGRWSVMRRGERVNVVLYALTGVSILAMTLELLAGPDAIPTDLATTPGGSASQTVATVKPTTTVTFTLPPDTEPGPPPVVTRAPAWVTAPPVVDEEPTPDPPANEEEEPEPTPTTQAPVTTSPTIPRTTPTTFSNTFPTPVPPVPPTFVGPPVPTTVPKIPAP